MDDNLKPESVDERYNYFTDIVILVISAVSYYWIFLSKRHASLFGRPCSTPRWNFGIKQLWALITIWRYRLLGKDVKKPATKQLLPTDEEVALEKRSSSITGYNSDVLRILCFDQSGNSICFSMSYYSSWCEVTLLVKLSDGSNYIHATSPTSLVVTTKSRNNEWEGGGLKFEMIEPLKRFRFTYNGLLKKISPESTLHHVRLNFIWSGCGKLIDLKNDWSAFLMSEALAREPWKQHEWYHLIKDQGSGFDQWGAMRGEIVIDSSAPIDLNLASLRQRRYGPAEAHTLVRRVGLTGFTKDGTLFYIRATCSPLGLSYAKFGHVWFANQTQAVISQCDIGLQNLSDSATARLPNNMLISFTAGGRHFTAFATTGPSAYVHGQNFIARLTAVELSLNGDCGCGVADFWYRVDDMYVAKPLTEMDESDESEVVDEEVMVASLSDKVTQNSYLTGGKGSSLAVLTSLKREEIQVPRGFCVTVNAFEKQLKQNKPLDQALKALAYFSEEDLKLRCEAVSSLIKTTPVCKDLERNIRQELEAFNDVSLAVRSSAVGEDSEDLSAAGQNSTYLGISGEKNVLTAVRDCWASAYSYQSVQYRRQHGQLIRCKMAVVIQEMVPADKAGVLFTRNPITGDPRFMLITANYGLGETVVAGDVDPDTIEISRNEYDTIAISSRKIGDKRHKLILSGDGTRKQDLTSGESSESCLTDDEILQLGNIGVSIERHYDSPRDIEWAVVGDKIYTLQARPVTSISQWTDHELLHEMDTPVVAETDITTVANAGEVLPGATTVLTQSILTAAINATAEQNIIRVSHHHAFLDLLTTLLREPSKEVSVSNRIGDLAVLGHELTTPELHQIAVRRNGVVGRLRQLGVILYSIRVAFQVRRHANEAVYLAKQFEMNAQRFESALELHRAITIQFPVLLQVTRLHQNASRNSVFFQAIALSLLSDGKPDLSNENFCDLTRILAVCSDVVSADIPAALKNMAIEISVARNAEDFTLISPSEGVKWLKENSRKGSTMLQQFLKKHGHRGMREFDLSAEVWGVDPSKLIETLQALVKQNLELKQTATEIRSPMVESPEDMVKTLKSPIKEQTRSVLKYIIRLCQMSVRYRETTKSSLIAVVHQFRLAFRKLGLLLVLEGLLPKSDLVFHLTHYEVQQLITTKNSSLVIKSIRRQRLWPQWDKLAFPEVMVGLPKPKQEKSSLELTSDVKVCGTPVYPGNVMGRAVVISDLKKIGQLKQGDILVTYCTDVGWSPCFPLLGGIVTELGGLISHGAVVAREYGLPCIVGAQNATSLFRTGDTVLLSGSKGLLQKISDQES